MTRVLLPTDLRSYTAGASEIFAAGATLGAVLIDVERSHRGFRVRVIDEQDRIRPFIKYFIAGERASTLYAAITGEVQIIAALSGG